MEWIRPSLGRLRLDGSSGCTESPRRMRADRGPGRVCIEALGLIRDLGRHPCGKRDFHECVSARCSVALMKLGQVLARELGTDTYQGRPKAAMDERDLGGNEAAHEDGVLSPDRLRDSKYFPGTWVRPPIAMDRRTRNGLGQRRHWPSSGLQDNPALADKGSSVLKVHRRDSRTLTPGSSRGAKRPRRG